MPSQITLGQLIVDGYDAAARAGLSGRSAAAWVALAVSGAVLEGGNKEAVRDLGLYPEPAARPRTPHPQRVTRLAAHAPAIRQRAASGPAPQVSHVAR